MIAIQIEGLSKEYRLGVIGHGTLTHDLQSWWARVRGKEDPNSNIHSKNFPKETNEKAKRFIALNDINLTVESGKILGIIGKNGAGKSTLLKILSRVTAPTRGLIKIRGRIASLLEVGTGFHPELTGKENIYLNGAILGMRKHEISKKIDEIIDFSGVELFIDTPVKRYSSGMYVRLAFAVAAHLESEILVVDEVLAVGDAEFQQKCLGKMNDVASDGRTVLFVSHNMAALGNLCKYSILLNSGSIIQEGSSDEIISFYLNMKETAPVHSLAERKDRKGNGLIIMQDIQVQLKSGSQSDLVKTGTDVIFRIYYTVRDSKKKKCRFSVNIDKDDQNFIILDSYVVQNKYLDVYESGFVDFVLYNLPLSKGIYSISLFLCSETDVMDWVKNVTNLVVEDGDFYGTGKQYPDGWAGKTVLVNYSVKSQLAC